jgi:hypothetical protein
VKTRFQAFAFKCNLYRYTEDEPGGGTLTEMPFGTVFFGDTMKKTCVVYNNGPVPVEFWVKVGAVQLNPVNP